MGKKIQISDTRKAEIKSQADKYLNGEILPRNKQEEQYLNKIKAGRARNETALKNSDGTFAKIPEQFKKKFIEPAIKQYNAETGQETTLKDFLRESDNRAFLNDIFLKDVTRYSYQPEALLDKALEAFTGKKITVDDGTGKTRELSKAQFAKLVRETEQNIREIGGHTFYTTAEYSEGFKKMRATIKPINPNKALDDYENDFAQNNDTGDFIIITSEKKKK